MDKPVLFRVTNNLNIGGVQRRLRALLPLLTEQYEVHVVTYKERGVFFEELATLGVHTHFLPRRGTWDPMAIWRLAQLFRKHNADIVHTHSFGGNVFGLLSAALARVPVRIGQVHLCALHWYGKTVWRRKKQALEERLIHRFFSQRILFVSQESREFFQKHTGLPDSMLVLLHNGFDLPDAVMPISREDLGIPQDRVIIGFVGRIAHGKGLECFLEMARNAQGQAPGKFHFLVIGSGCGLNAKKSWVREQGLEKTITFLGERREIHRYYATLDGLAFCSDPGVEGMPGVVLEACAHGLPILARRSAAIEEIHGYYPRITFFDEDLPTSVHLENALLRPSVDPAPLRQEFSIEAMRQRTHSLYAELLSQVRR